MGKEYEEVPMFTIPGALQHCKVGTTISNTGTQKRILPVVKLSEKEVTYDGQASNATVEMIVPSNDVGVKMVVAAEDIFRDVPIGGNTTKNVESGTVANFPSNDVGLKMVVAAEDTFDDVPIGGNTTNNVEIGTITNI